MEVNSLPVRFLSPISVCFPAQERHVKPLVVENVVRLESRHVLLQEPEAVSVDRPDEGRAEPVERACGPSRSSTRAEIRSL